MMKPASTMSGDMCNTSDGSMGSMGPNGPGPGGPPGPPGGSNGSNNGGPGMENMDGMKNSPANGPGTPRDDSAGNMGDFGMGGYGSNGGNVSRFFVAVWGLILFFIYFLFIGLMVVSKETLGSLCGPQSFFYLFGVSLERNRGLWGLKTKQIPLVICYDFFLWTFWLGSE